MEPRAPSPAEPGLNSALERLWTRFLPQTRERAALIEAAVQSFAAGSLSAEQQEAAASAAHKLAGVLGSFDLQRGTDVARELEVAFSTTPDNPVRLAALASELRSLIESRGNG